MYSDLCSIREEAYLRFGELGNLEFDGVPVGWYVYIIPGSSKILTLNYTPFVLRIFFTESYTFVVRCSLMIYWNFPWAFYSGTEGIARYMLRLSPLLQSVEMEGRQDDSNIRPFFVELSYRYTLYGTRVLSENLVGRQQASLSTSCKRITTQARMTETSCL